MKEEKVKKQKAAEQEPVDVKKEVISWIKTLVAVVVVVLVLTQVVFINARVPSGSMENTIMTHDRLIGFRFSYWGDKGPERGDIALFRYPLDEKTIFIKRVIGLPGETVEIRDGLIYIDGSDTPLNEDYLPEEWFIDNDGFTFEVPEDSYLMMGDNRNNSLDARYWAEYAYYEGLTDSIEEGSEYTYVSKDKILGKAMFKYFRSFGMLNNTAHYE